MKKKILIVEDDSDLVYVLQRLMGLLGHDTIAAKTGKEAVKIAVSKLPVFAAGGGGAQVMTNQNGVEMHLFSVSMGADFTLGAKGLNVRMDK